MLYKIGVSRNFAKFTGKYLCQSLFFNKVADLRDRWKKRTWLRCFPVNFAKFLRAPFLQNTSGRLHFLYMLLTCFSHIFQLFLWHIAIPHFDLFCKSSSNIVRNFCGNLLWQIAIFMRIINALARSQSCNYMFKVYNRNATARCEICSIKTPGRRSGVFIVNFEIISYPSRLFLLLILSKWDWLGYQEPVWKKDTCSKLTKRFQDEEQVVKYWGPFQTSITSKLKTVYYFYSEATS